jgi:hypothetical protein
LGHPLLSADQGHKAGWLYGRIIEDEDQSEVGIWWQVLILKKVLTGKCRLESSVIDIPFIITWGDMSIANGALVLLVSLAAIAIAAAQLRSLAVPFAALSFFCFVTQLALYATTQVPSTPLKSKGVQCTGTSHSKI